MLRVLESVVQAREHRVAQSGQHVDLIDYVVDQLLSVRYLVLLDLFQRVIAAFITSIDFLYQRNTPVGAVPEHRH